MVYRYTCAACGLVVRIDPQASGKDVVACSCAAEVTEEVEQEES